MHFKVKLTLLSFLFATLTACENNSEEDSKSKTATNAAPVIVAGATLEYTKLANSNVYHYVDWTSAAPSAGTASGAISLDTSTSVSVDFAAINEDGSPGQLFFAQTNGGTNYWLPASPYISNDVSNSPPDSDIIALIGGRNQRYVVTLSQPIKDPIMAIVSLGQPNINVTYAFDTPFAIVSQGVGYWGGNANALSNLDGYTLSGNEGHGTIRFIGTYATFSWLVPNPENWHGFTFAIRTTEANEPSIIDGFISISDADDSELSSAQASISVGKTAGDILSFTPMAKIDGSYDPVTAELNFIGVASLQDYQQILRSVRYNSVSDDPTVGGSQPNRTITWTVTDANSSAIGAQTSAPVTSMIHITIP